MVLIDEWIKSAILDNSLVAHLLLSLKHSSIPNPPFLFNWGAKKPRSKHHHHHHHPSSTAASPTTPLSWTASADAYEHFSRSKDIQNKKATFVAHIAGNGNDSFKRRKLDLDSISHQHLPVFPRILHSTSTNAAHQVHTKPQATRIVIPDLNMMPPPEEEEEEEEERIEKQGIVVLW